MATPTARWRRLRTACWLVLAATAVQLAVGAVSDLPQFAGKGFGARLLAYPLLMLAVPFGAALRRGARARAGRPWAPLPWAASLLVMLPFLVDVTGNTADLYDRVAWWDDANHLVNWALLSAGAGLLLRAGGVRPPWALGWLVAGVGALLAVAWEVGEYLAFIRYGTELATAYTDTLGDLVLGCCGAGAAGALLAVLERRRAAPGTA